MFEIIFEKRNGKYDAMLVKHGAEWVVTEVPKQLPILHDMFHHAVETTLSRRGFVHRMASGERGGYRMAPDDISEGIERLVETMQADSWSGRPDPADVIEMFRTTCEARGSAAFDISADDIVAIRSAIDDLAMKWAAVPVGGRLVLEVQGDGA